MEQIKPKVAELPLQEIVTHRSRLVQNRSETAQQVLGNCSEGQMHVTSTRFLQHDQSRAITITVNSGDSKLQEGAGCLTDNL